MPKPNYIGQKKVKFSKNSGERTAGGVEIVKVQYEDGTEEHFSKLMFDKIVDTKPCDETQLRKKRLYPVFKILATVMREWGVKVGELTYLSSLMNNSLQNSSDAALIKLVSKWMPKPLSLDDVDYLTVDRILKDDNKPTQ